MLGIKTEHVHILEHARIRKQSGHALYYSEEGGMCNASITVFSGKMYV